VRQRRKFLAGNFLNNLDIDPADQRKCNFFVRLKGPFLRPGQPHAKHRAQATVNNRGCDRNAAPKASLTVASTVLL